MRDKLKKRTQSFFIIFAAVAVGHKRKCMFFATPMFVNKINDKHIDIHTVRRHLRNMTSTLDATRHFDIPDSYKFINSGGVVKLKKRCHSELVPSATRQYSDVPQGQDVAIHNHADMTAPVDAASSQSVEQIVPPDNAVETLSQQSGENHSVQLMTPQFRSDTPTFYMETIFAEHVGGDEPASTSADPSTSLPGRILTLTDPSDDSSITAFLTRHNESVIQQLSQELDRRVNQPIKVQFAVDVKYSRSVVTDDDIVETNSDRRHSTDFFVVNSTADIQQKLADAKRILQLISDTSVHQGSGYHVAGVNAVGLVVMDYHTNSGASFLPLPEHIAAKKACININNSDSNCFEYCMLYHLFQNRVKKNPQRVDRYASMAGALNMSRCSMPMTDINIDVFEQQNHIAVNLYMLDVRDQTSQVPKLFRLSSFPAIDLANLLLLKDHDRRHYVYIKSLERLFGDKNIRKHLCPRCMHAFSRRQALVNHLSAGCSQQLCCQLYLPSPPDASTSLDRTKVNFRMFHHKYPVEGYITADIRCILRPAHDRNGFHRDSHQVHTPFSVTYHMLPKHGEIHSHSFVSTTSDRCVQQFLRRLQSDSRYLKRAIQRHDELTMSDEARLMFQTATLCHICGHEFDNPKDKVRDHDHATGRFRGAAHNKCNLQYNNRWLRIPVIISNLAKYAAHFMICAAHAVPGRFKIIPRTSEQFTAFSWSWGEGITLEFRDSLAYLDESIDVLAHDLIQYPANFDDLLDGLETHWPGLPRTLLQSLTAATPFPCDVITSDDSLLKAFPHIDDFYSKVQGEHIDTNSYNCGQTTWDVLKCANLQDYADACSQTHLCLLDLVVQTFRSRCLTDYRLDPLWYVSAPGMFWDAALLDSKLTLDLFSRGQEPIHNIVRRGIRGGFCSALEKRHAKANNPECPHFDSSLPRTWLMCFDVNSMYPSVMQEPLPVGDYRMLASPNGFDIMNVDIDGDTGYIIDCDLTYPADLHDRHNAFPLAVEMMSPNVSDWTQALMDNTQQNRSSQQKLIASLSDKTNYVVHLKTLRFYLHNGIVLKKINHVISFKQAPWLKQYINKCGMRRAHAQCQFTKRLHKLSANSIYGKFLEDPSQRMRYTLVQSSQTLQRQVAKHTLRHIHRFSNNLVGLHILPRSAVLNRPIAVGFTILDLAKLALYRIHYQHFLPLYGPERLDLCYTDTDSLIYLVQTHNVYHDISCHKRLFDLSNYPTDHYLYSSTSIAQAGLLKDDFAGETVYEVVCLRPKVYAVRAATKIKKRAKGVQHLAVSRQLDFQAFKSCLLDRNHPQCTVTFDAIRSNAHRVQTVHVRKLALSANDDKRYYLNANDSLAHGHYRITSF